MRDAELAARLEALTDFLVETQPFWGPRPFVDRVLPWEAELPALAAWLRALPEDRVEALEADVFSGVGAAPEPFGALAARIRALSPIEALDADPRPVPGERRAVPARKRAQVERFAAVAVGAVGRGAGLLDWCSGKGHLGRALAQWTGQPLRLLEQDPALARAGEARAREEGVDCAAIVGDALDPQTHAAMRPGEAAVALHACGALTDTLLREAHARGLSAVVVAPCCYHRYQRDELGARSAAGRAAGLRWPKDLCRLVTAEEVVARPKLRALRRQEMAWRLGLDAALREATGEDRYHTLPPTPGTVVQLPFAAFCAQVAGELGLPLPSGVDRFEPLGWDLARQARALAMLRCLFRRPLELWLVLDRALSLAEVGWSVEVGTFCERALTPRNLLIRARR